MWEAGGIREVREVLLNSHRSFWTGGAGKVTCGTKATLIRNLGPMLSLGDFSKLGTEGCSWVSAQLIPPSPPPFSGPEGGDLTQTATASGCLQIPAQLPKPLSCFHSRSWAGELGVSGSTEGLVRI